MIYDITELDEKAQRMRVAWNKANNFYSTFMGDLADISDVLKSGRYGNDWTLPKWLFMKVGVFEKSVLTILKAHENALADEERERLAARERELARQRSEARAAAEREAASRRTAAEAARAEAARLRAEREAARAAAAAEKKRQKANAASRKSYRKKRDAEQEAIRKAAEAAEAARRAEAQAQAEEEAKRQGKPPPVISPRLAVLIEECNQIAKHSRVELGRRFAEMKELVETYRAGIDPATGNYWLWGAWCQVHLEWTRQHVGNCIREFGNNVSKSSDNVVPILRA